MKRKFTWLSKKGLFEERSLPDGRTGGGVTPGSRPKAILICYGCGPGVGSECGSGWAWARAASEVADVILITLPVFRDKIEQAISEFDLPITVKWVKTPSWTPRLSTGAKLINGTRYCLWHLRAARLIRQIEAEERVDVAHHVTFASDSFPTALLASRAPVRIWGPVGGTTRTAFGLYRYLGVRGIIAELVRDVATGLLRMTSGTLTARHATLVVALNQDGERHWKRLGRPVVVESNTSLEPGELGELGEQSGVGPSLGRPTERVALFVGRLIPLKGLRLAVRSLLYAPDWKLVVFGEGPERVPAEKLAERLGVSNRLEFRGQVPRAEVLDAFRSADALLFPSFHDSSPWAVGEAASLGCPVVCLDVGGPSLQAGANGRVVPLRPTASLHRRIGERLQGLSGRGNPEDHLLESRIPPLLKSWYTDVRL
jgi:glycosyltransferase involved in cell wall biosynthesis